MDGLDLEWVSGKSVPRGELMALINAAFGIYPFWDEPRLPSVEALEDEAGPAASFVIARSGATAVGCAMIRPTDGMEWGVGGGRGIRSADAMYLGLAAVAPELRKGGIGRAMLAEAEREARRRGFGRMTLGTIAEMDNVVYYAAMGYESVDTVHFDAGHWGLRIPHEFHVMVKTLAGRDV